MRAIHNYTFGSVLERESSLMQLSCFQWMFAFREDNFCIVRYVAKAHRILPCEEFILVVIYSFTAKID